MRMRAVSLKRAPLLTSDLGCKHSTSKRPTQFPPFSNLQIFIHLSFPLEGLRSVRKIHEGDQSRESSSGFWSFITAAIVPPYMKEQPFTTAIDRKKGKRLYTLQEWLRMYKLYSNLFSIHFLETVCRCNFKWHQNSALIASIPALVIRRRRSYLNKGKPHRIVL